MTTGTIKFYNNKLGFGYIAVDPRTDVYVEADAVKESGLGRLRSGDQLSFEVVELPNGKTRAANLKLITGAPRVEAEQHFKRNNNADAVRFGDDPTTAASRRL